MHELPLTQSLVDLVLSHLRAAGGGRVTAVHVVIGELSGAMEDSIGFYWEILARDTPAEGAALRFRRIPFLLGCHDCDVTFPPSGTEHRCPRCGGRSLHFVAGDDLRLEALDVEPEPAAATRSPSP